jgi:hypothetical protein
MHFYRRKEQKPAYFTTRAALMLFFITKEKYTATVPLLVLA